jgi:hypothetical protein
MMLINEQKLEIINQLRSKDYIFAKMRERSSGEVMIVATVYIPPIDSKQLVESSLLDVKMWTETETEAKIVIVGDLNARIGSEDIRSALFKQSSNLSLDRRSADSTGNQQGRELLDTANDADLTILNGRTNGDIEGNYIFIGPNGSSVIDICLVNSLALEDVTKFEVGSWSLSPHNPIHLSLGRKIHTTIYLPTRIKWNQNNLKEYQSRMELDKLVSYDSLIKSK